METLIIQPESKEQLNALKAFIKALKIKFKLQTISTLKVLWKKSLKVKKT
jgi:hypothetical protein